MKSRKKKSFKQQLFLLGITLLIGGVGLNLAGWNALAPFNVPVRMSSGKIYASRADAFFEGDLETQKSLAAQVIADIEREIDASSFETGSDRYNGEWAVVAYQMTALGLTQIALAHPEVRDEYIPTIEKCLDELVRSDTLSFGSQAWGEDGLTNLDSQNGHAYLGYVNLALSMYRQLKPDNRFAEINDRLTESLARRIERSPHGIIETYPHEAYPPDLAAVLGSIALHDRATGKNRQPLLQKSLQTFRQKFVDKRSGLVFQSVDASSGKVQDSPRASGTALSIYYLSFADPQLSQQLHRAIALQKTNVTSMAGIREYPDGEEGTGDVDSGPLIMGMSPSASVFAISGSRVAGDRQLFKELYRSLDLFGGFSNNQNSVAFKMGGSLGKTILLAMVTAPVASDLHE